MCFILRSFISRMNTNYLTLLHYIIIKLCKTLTPTPTCVEVGFSVAYHVLSDGADDFTKATKVKNQLITLLKKVINLRCDISTWNAESGTQLCFLYSVSVTKVGAEQAERCKAILEPMSCQSNSFCQGQALVQI